MATTEITTKDHERYGHARARGKARAEDPSAVIHARYNSDADAIDLRFSGGGSMSIPRRIVPGLERASAAKMESIAVSPAGDALLWPSLDVDVYVPDEHRRRMVPFQSEAASCSNACSSPEPEWSHQRSLAYW